MNTENTQADKFMTSGPLKKRLSRKKVVGALLIVVIVGAAVYPGLHYLKEWQLTRTINSPALKGYTPKQKAVYFSENGNYKAAERVWKDQLDSAKSPEARVLIYSSLAGLSERQKDYSAAQEYATSALKLMPNSDTPYVIMAQLAQAKGDKTAAKKYWQKAIDYIDPNSLGANLTKLDYQRALDSLQ